MSIDLGTYLNQKATHTASGGKDLYGKTTDGAQTELDVRFQDSVKRLQDVKGEEFVADGEFWLYPDAAIALNEFLTHGGVKYKIVRIDTKRGFDGEVHHKKAYVVRVA